MVNFLLDHVLEIREQMKYPLAMLLDEFTNFGKISGIGDTLSIIRKNKIGLVLGFQNYFQLEQVYSKREAQIIIDMPATQIYFKQKTFQEARDLSEAIGRTTIEEATVSDSGRVQEIIQGRHLITPDELISLNKEVIVFTADVKPLRLPLTSPTAYDHALSYPAPIREKHEVSEFVRKRGRTARDQSRDEGQDQDQNGKKTERPKPNNNKKSTSKQQRNNQRFDRGRAPKLENEKEEVERKPFRKPDNSPDSYI